MAIAREVVTQGGVWGGQAAVVVGSSVSASVVAVAGGTQAGALAAPTSFLSSSINNIATCATGADSCVLPDQPSVGDDLWVRNNGAASCTIYPRTGGTINGAAANAGIAVANAKTAHFKAISSLNWIAIVTA